MENNRNAKIMGGLVLVGVIVGAYFLFKKGGLDGVSKKSGNDYLVSYKYKKGKVVHSFYNIKADNEDEAIKKAKDQFLSDWYEGKIKGLKELKKRTFFISK
jgi:hypothetical protein